MRRIGSIALVAFALVAFAIPTATAKSVTNEQYREDVVEGGWYQGEWGDEVLVSGYAGARLRHGADAGEMYFSQSVGTAVTCDAGTPDDPGDDYLGYEWVTADGWAPATVAVGKSFAGGVATATVEAWLYTYSDCDVYYPENGGGAPATFEVAMVLAGDGPLVRARGSNSFHVPGEYNEHSKSSSTYRNAVGTVTVDGTPFDVAWGQIGEYRWSLHVNSK